MVSIHKKICNYDHCKEKALYKLQDIQGKYFCLKHKSDEMILKIY